MENNGDKIAEEALYFSDYRVFKGFLRLQLFYGSTLFMKPKYDMNKEADINCLHRVKNLCKLNNFRTVQHSDVSSQYKAALLALK